MGDIGTYPPQNVSAQTPVLGYAETLTGLTGISGVDTNIPGLSITITVPAGRRIQLSAYGLFQKKTSASYIWYRIYEGSTVVAADLISLGIDEYAVMKPTTIITPTTGTHTYRVVAYSGATTADLLSIVDYKAYILAEDITGSQLPVLPQSVPVGLLGQAQVVSDITGFGTTNTAIAGLSVNVSVPAGRTLRATFSGDAWWGASAAAIAVWGIWEDGVRVAECEGNVPISPGDFPIVPCIAIRSPSAGSHTYQVYCRHSTGTFNMGANNAPARLVVEDITPTPAPGQGAPGSTLGYVENFGNAHSITTTLSDVPGGSVTVTVPEGRRLRVTAKSHISTGATATRLGLKIREGTTEHNSWWTYLGSLNGGMEAGVEAIISPTAGTHTYKLSAIVQNDTAAIYTTGTIYNYILVEDITGAVWPVGSAVTAGMVANEVWTSYTPTLSNITLGNGVRSGRYTRIGRTIHATGYFSMGSTSSVSGRPSIGLPVAAASSIGQFGSGYILDSGNVEYPAIVRLSDIGPAEVMFLVSGVGAPNGVYNSTTPFAMGTGDTLGFSITYEAAS